MRLALVVAATACAAALDAQQPRLESLRILAQGTDSTALVARVRERPDDARELIRALTVRAAARTDRAADSSLTLARRVATAYAVAWADSFPLLQVRAFDRLPARRRAAKLAADSVRRRGNEVLTSAGPAAARAIWREALRRSTHIADSAGVAAALGNIGVGFYRSSDLDSATSYLARALAMADAIGDQRTALNALGALASVAKDRGDLRAARETYLRAAARRSRIGDARGLASDHTNLGLIASEIGDLTEARREYGQALAIARRQQLDEPAAAALVNFGNAASAEADYAEAARHYREALAIYRASGNVADAALVLHNLGLLALRRGDYRVATARLTEALAAFERAGTHADLVLVRRDLATVAAATGDLRLAMRELGRADRMVDDRDEPELAADVTLTRADIASQLNELAVAERLYARAEQLYRRAGRISGEAEARQGRAAVLVERRQFALALQLLDNALRAHVGAGDRRPAALTALLIAHVQREKGDLASAHRSARDAVDSLAALQDVVGEAAALGLLADVELDRTGPLVAEALYRDALAKVRARPAGAVTWQLRAGLGRVLHARGASSDAARELRAAIADIERQAAILGTSERRLAFLADKWDVYGQLALVEGKRGDPESAFAVSERMRARQTLDLLARGRLRLSGADSAALDREQDLRRQIGELTQLLETRNGRSDARRGPTLAAANGLEPLAVREALARAQERYAQTLLELRDGEPSPVVQDETASWRDVAARLSKTDALIEYLVDDSTSLAFVVTRDTLRLVDLGVSRQTLESLVDFARGTITASASGSRSAAWVAPMRRLYGYLVAPIEQASMLASVRRLYIVPHAELHYLSFAALVTNDGERGRPRFLIEQYEVAYAPSATVWAKLDDRRRPATDGILAVAPRTASLPGTRDEIAAIRAVYGRDATVLTDAAASEGAFRGHAVNRNVIHLATYGILNKHNPLFSYVSLAPGGDGDGRLEVHEVFALQLNTRLLVLSACQTALGSGARADVPEGDDWVGFVRAFLTAGASNVLATLWPVEDRSTGVLMSEFYQRLGSGQSEIVALAAAQREILRKPDTASPFYWAAFVLVGGRQEG